MNQVIRVLLVSVVAVMLWSGCKTNKIPYKNVEFRLVTSTGKKAYPSWDGKKKFFLTMNAFVESKDIAEIKANKDKELTVVLNKRGRDMLAKITEKNAGKRIALVVSGKVLLAPAIKAKITSGINRIKFRSKQEMHQILQLVSAKKL